MRTMAPMQTATPMRIVFWGLLAALAGAPAYAADEVDTAALVGHFEGLASGEGWSTDLRRFDDELDPATRAKIRSGHVWSAMLVGTEMRAISVMALRYASEQTAIEAVQELRKAPLGPMEMEARAKVHVDSTGGGAGGKLPGFFTERSLPEQTPPIRYVAHAVRKGALVVRILAIGLPELDRSVQDAFLTYAFEKLANPLLEKKSPQAPKIARDVKSVVLTIRDPFGALVPLADVVVTGTGAGNFVRALCTHGLCNLELDKSEAVVYVIRARDANDKALPVARAKVKLPADATELAIQLPTERVIAGHVRDDRGKPVAGVVVSANNLDAMMGPLFEVDNPLEATTNGSGQFQIHHLEAGKYSLSVRDDTPRFLHVEGDHRDVEAGRRDVELRTVRPLTLRFRVVDPDDRPVVGARVRAVRIQDHDIHYPGDTQSRTDATGRIELTDLEPAEAYRIVLTPPDKRTDLSKTTVMAPATPRERTLAFNEGWTLRVRTVDANGKPVAATVEHRFDKQMMGEVARTKADGTLVIRHLPLAKVEVWAFTPPHLNAHVEDDRRAMWVEPGREAATIVASERTPLFVRAVGADGKPIPHFKVWLVKGKRSHGDSSEAATALLSRPAPPYTVRVHDPRGVAGERLDAAPKTVRVTEKGREKLVLRLEAGARFAAVSSTPGAHPYGACGSGPTERASPCRWSGPRPTPAGTSSSAGWSPAAIGFAPRTTTTSRTARRCTSKPAQRSPYDSYGPAGERTPVDLRDALRPSCSARGACPHHARHGEGRARVAAGQGQDRDRLGAPVPRRAGGREGEEAGPADQARRIRDDARRGVVTRRRGAEGGSVLRRAHRSTGEPALRALLLRPVQSRRGRGQGRTRIRDRRAERARRQRGPHTAGVVHGAQRGGAG